MRGQYSTNVGLSDKQKSDRIFGNIIDDVPVDDTNETGTGAFRPPTTNMKVPKTLL